MNLPIIDGRECVPVRLLPFLTAWRPLSPDVVARLFSRREEWHRWSISSFNLRPDGKYHELPPSAWDQIDDDLTVLAQDLKRQEHFEFEKYPEWRQRSVERLPASVFVWRDELVADYARTFGRMKFLSLRPGAGGCSEEEAEAELEMINRLCRNPDTSKEADAAIERFKQAATRDTVYRPGDGELNFAPLLSAEEEKIVFEGFESVLAGSGSQQATRAPQAQQKGGREGASTIEVFYSYSHKDEALRDELEKHLTLFKRQGLIRDWHDRRITAGSEWSGKINDYLNSAGVILLLVSADFLASNYCYDVEMKRAMERHTKGEAVVIPIILRAVDWQSAPFAMLQPLPKDTKAVTSWVNRDEAFADIARGIREAVEKLANPT